METRPTRAVLCTMKRMSHFICDTNNNRNHEQNLFFQADPMTCFPFVSVIIPVHNDPDGIRHTLRSLFSQSYPKSRYEIIVVDNHSDDQTLSEILKIIPAFDGHVIVKTETAKGSYAARNKGIRNAKGEILAFVDADMTVGPEWISKGVQCIGAKQADYVGCRVDIVPSGKQVALWEKYDMAFGFPVKSYMKIDGYAPTACLFLKKSVVDMVGNFDSRLLSGGDCEFGTRIRDHGFRMVYDPDNVMVHPARHFFSALVKKQKRVTLGQIRLRRLFPQRFACNGFSHIMICCIQLLPMASPVVFKKLSRFPDDFFRLFFVFYLLRLYTYGLKFLNRCFF